MFVDVAVDFSDRDRLRTYTYAVPKGISVEPGDLVWIPFGYRPIQGIAIEVSESTAAENVSSDRQRGRRRGRSSRSIS